MDRYRLYVIETIAFGMAALLSAAGAVYFLASGECFLGIIGALMTLVALDNVFCSSRMKTCGIMVNTHWAVPPFLKRPAREKTAIMHVPKRNKQRRSHRYNQQPPKNVLLHPR